MQQQWDVHINEPSYRSFFVRLWCEPGSIETVLRGEVEHIQSGEIVEVSSLDEAIRLISQTMKRDEEQ